MLAIIQMQGRGQACARHVGMEELHASPTQDSLFGSFSDDEKTEFRKGQQILIN